EADSQSLVREAIPFTPGVHEYWDTFLMRILELGFNGFVLEDPETYHVPNENEQCYKTFWEPWAKQYRFRSVADTNKNSPPLGVHVEYYAWLFREFDKRIQKHARELGRPPAEVFLISHILLDRIMKESKSREEQARWLALVDQKHGRKVPFVLFEDHEEDYVALLGKDRAATLGGRGGAAAGCFRIASINNDRMHGDLGMDLAEERAKQRRMIEAGGLGGMAYVFQWSNTEVFGYLGAQHLWQHLGAPGINNEDAFGFMDYAYRMYYGGAVGSLAAMSYTMNPCVNEYTVLEEDLPTVFLGAPLHREYQLLVVMAEESDRLAREAYRLYAGHAPDLFHPVYDPDTFRWDGYDGSADKIFKTERLRLLCVSARQAKELCTAAWTSRVAKQRMAEGASIGAVRRELDAAVAAARANERLYFANYEDDYTTGAKCTEIAAALEATRSRFMADCGAVAGGKIDAERPVPEAVRKAVKRRRIIHWERQIDVLPQVAPVDKPGLYLSTDIGLSGNIDFFCLGEVFTVQARGADGAWRTIFRRAVLKKDAGWQHWDIPLDSVAGKDGSIHLRLMTDGCSRAMDRDAPAWKWGYWGRPQVVQVAADGTRRVRFDLVEEIDRARPSVRLDDTGKRRSFDGKGKDSTGATFRWAAQDDDTPRPTEPAIAAFAPHCKGNSGVTIGEYEIGGQR
ncbi:MAG: hypothetical protein ABSG53_21685, partial [Thermoguttaceae bacterium]